MLEGQPGSPVRGSAPKQEIREWPEGLSPRVLDVLESSPGEGRGKDGAEEVQRGEGEVIIAGGENDEEWPVLVLGGWLADDIEALLRVSTLSVVFSLVRSASLWTTRLLRSLSLRGNGIPHIFGLPEV